MAWLRKRICIALNILMHGAVCIFNHKLTLLLLYCRFVSVLSKAFSIIYIFAEVTGGLFRADALVMLHHVVGVKREMCVSSAYPIQ